MNFNRRCGMIVYQRAIHQMKVKFKLLQVPLQPSIMNQSLYHNGSCKRPQNTNVKLFTKHDNRSNLLKSRLTVALNLFNYIPIFILQLSVLLYKYKLRIQKKGICIVVLCIMRKLKLNFRNQLTSVFKYVHILKKCRNSKTNF